VVGEAATDELCACVAEEENFRRMMVPQARPELLGHGEIATEMLDPVRSR
jgi:hypothetical protein